LFLFFRSIYFNGGFRQMTYEEELKLILEGKHYSKYLNGKLASKIVGIDNGIYILESIKAEQGFSNTPVLMTEKTKNIEFC